MKQGRTRKDPNAPQVFPLPAREQEFSIAGSPPRSRQASAQSTAPPTARSESPKASRMKSHPRNPRRPSRPAECKKPTGLSLPAESVSPEQAPAQSTHSEAAWSARQDRRKAEAEWP